LTETGGRRVAVVTGAGSGIGRAIALRLAAAGMAVVIAGRDLARGEAVAGEIAATRGDAAAVRCDVTDRASVAAALERVRALHGGVDVLVNNAGFDEFQPFLETDPGSWERLVAVNLFGVLNCTHAIAPAIVERCRATGFGRIVNIASDASRVGSTGEAVYSAAKGGVVAFSKSLARELAREGVTVNVVCPGPTETPMMDAILATRFGGKVIERIVAASPRRRMSQPEEIAGAVAYFAGEEAGFVTGQVLSVSGGLTMAG
jgi:2-hydroxycyclohexanecarboxyl-CoA dehydrogenase